VPPAVAPGTHAQLGRAAYYRAQADRIDTLAADAAPHEGRARFEQVAQEYRSLADSLDAPDDPDDLSSS
jgi:hypothetical protein